MGIKVIDISPHLGEIGFENDFRHNFYGGNFTEFDGEEDIYFEVDIHVIQEETNTVLRVQKEFENYEHAKSFFIMFISKNPISEGIIVKQIRKEMMHYV